MKWLALLFLASISVSIGRADETGCDAASDQATMNRCADQAYRASDVKLNEAFQTLGRQVSDAGRTRLRQAQRAWIAYRDAQCAFETSGSADGSIHPMIVAGCLDGLTRAQTARLVAQANCEEGDLSCGGQ